MTYNFLSSELRLNIGKIELIYVEPIMSSRSILSVLITALQFTFSCYDPLIPLKKKIRVFPNPHDRSKNNTFCKEDINITDAAC